MEALAIDIDWADEDDGRGVDNVDMSLDRTTVVPGFDMARFVRTALEESERTQPIAPVELASLLGQLTADASGTRLSTPGSSVEKLREHLEKANYGAALSLVEELRQDLEASFVVEDHLLALEEKMQGEIGEESQLVEALARPDLPEVQHLSRDAQSVLWLCDGKRSVAALAEASELPRLQALAAIVELMKHGAIALVQVQAAAAT